MLDVDVIEPDRGLSDQDFVRPRRRDFVLLVTQDRGRPGARHDNPIGTHARGPLLYTIGQC